MKWYKLYLEATIYPDNLKPQYIGPLKLRALVVLALARRDAAANLLRSREEFYAELRRLSAHNTGVTIRDVGTNPIRVIKELRKLDHDSVLAKLRAAGATVE